MVRVYLGNPPGQLLLSSFILALVLGEGVSAPQDLDQAGALVPVLPVPGLGAAQPDLPSIEPSRIHHLFMPFTFVTE